MDTDDSDIDSKTVLLPPKKLPKENTSPTKENVQHGKKLTTKLMIIDALTELKSRKGVSLYAIKTHLTEKFQVNTDKLNFMIKKTLKACVEDGTFVQLKGVGASGSFKLAAKVTKPKKKKETEKGDKEQKKEKSEKKMKKILEKGPITKSKQKVKESKVEIKETKKVNKKQTSVDEKKKKPKMETMEGKEKKNKVKMMVAKEKDNTAKKRAAMMKRRSIGSIIKPPKMKPKNK